MIHVEDHPISFARVEKITPDHKPGWYHVKLLFLQIPLRVVTWILRDIYIDGAEFTMGGQRMRLAKVVCPRDAADPESPNRPAENGPVMAQTTTPSGTVISLADRKKSSPP